MTTEKFWLTWLKISAIITTLLGVLMALFNHTNMFEIMNMFIQSTFYADTSITSSAVSLQQWMIGVFGATMAGWGIMMLYLIKHSLQNKELWAWNAMLISLIVWFSIDMVVSIHFKAFFNVLVNAIFFLQFLAPLMVLRKSMIKSS
jgi:hypothetical protein